MRDTGYNIYCHSVVCDMKIFRIKVIAKKNSKLTLTVTCFCAIKFYLFQRIFVIVYFSMFTDAYSIQKKINDFKDSWWNKEMFNNFNMILLSEEI